MGWLIIRFNLLTLTFDYAYNASKSRCCIATSKLYYSNSVRFETWSQYATPVPHFLFFVHVCAGSGWLRVKCRVQWWRRHSASTPSSASCPSWRASPPSRAASPTTRSAFRFRKFGVGHWRNYFCFDFRRHSSVN